MERGRRGGLAHLPINDGEVNQMGMVEKLDELKLRREKVEAGGGAERVEKQHKSGKKTAR